MDMVLGLNGNLKLVSLFSVTYIVGIHWNCLNVYLQFILKPSSNRSPYIFTLVQKVKHRVYKIHAFENEAILCRDLLPNLFLNSHIETGSVQKSKNFNLQKWTNQVLLCLAYSVQIKILTFNKFTRSYR